jgi:hypothetical protein
MKRRCYDARAVGYDRYGGQGIAVCDQWRDSFETFLQDMGERPLGTTLERKKNSLGYDPDNCVWATPKQQARNRCDNHYLTVAGKTLTIMEWSELTGINEQTIHERLRRKWCETRAVMQKVKNAI